VPNHHFAERPRARWGIPAACSAATALSLGLIWASTGPVRLTGVLVLLGAFIGSIWIAHQARFTAIAPAVGLALGCLILIGLVLAVLHALNADAVALAIGAVSATVAWVSGLYPAADVPERGTSVKPARPMAVGGAVIFAAAAALAVHYSAVSARAGSAEASSLAVWAYPAGQHLLVGAQQPAGHGSTSLRIVVIQAGITTAAWNDVRLAPGQTWRARPFTMTGNGPARVVARRGGVVVASFSIELPRTRTTAHSTITAKPSRPRSTDPAARARK
jgi:hypothetical protein